MTNAAARPAREQVKITVLGESISLEMSAAARTHLESCVSLLEDDGACLSHLVQAIAVAAATPAHPREAAASARMTYARWLAVVSLAATGYSSLGRHITLAREALFPSI